MIGLLNLVSLSDTPTSLEEETVVGPSSAWGLAARQQRHGHTVGQCDVKDLDPDDEPDEWVGVVTEDPETGEWYADGDYEQPVDPNEVDPIMIIGGEHAPES